MDGYVAQRRGRFYAVIYQGLDPVTGKERRSWHPAGTDRAEAERLAKKLAAEETKRTDAVRSLTFGAYLTSQWLPAKELHLATSTYRGYKRNVQLHILPVLGRTRIRRLRYQQIEALYEMLLHPETGRGLAPKTVYEIHLIIRGSLTDAHRRGLVTRNVALVARAPKQRSLQRTEGKALTEEQLRQLLRTAAGHRFFPIYWLTAMTGMRRNEVLGLKWSDVDVTKKRLHLNRGLVAVGYEVHQTRGKTKTARRTIELDETTIAVLEGWRAYQAAEFAAVGIDLADDWMFSDGHGEPVHPHALYQAFRRIVHNAQVPPIRFHDLRHTHGTLLIKEGVPVKVVSERLGHAHIAHTLETYQHVLPGMQADAARTAERLAEPRPSTKKKATRRAGKTSVERRGNNRRKAA
ncbi:MAG: site-specific integrase [Acidimicrobiales bacterium]|nr:site-specific integrase [Mycobacterium sp.]MCB0987703.1 site-specific integrase [Acidimicrobiales bacterium]